MGELHSTNTLRTAEINLKSASFVMNARRAFLAACHYLDANILAIGADDTGGIS
jgi:hypothetical protein